VACLGSVGVALCLQLLLGWVGLCLFFSCLLMSVIDVADLCLIFMLMADFLFSIYRFLFNQSTYFRFDELNTTVLPARSL
jgi:hypothetical protein